MEAVTIGRWGGEGSGKRKEDGLYTMNDVINGTGKGGLGVPENRPITGK